MFKKIFNKWRKKEQFTNEKYVEGEITAIGNRFELPLFSRKIALTAYTGYVAAALDYNSNAATTGIIRLWGKKSKNGQKNKYPTIQHPDIYQRKFMAGKLEDKVSNDVNIKMMNSLDDFEIIQDHPIIDLFLRANPFQTMFELFFSMYLSLLTTGDVFIHIVNFKDRTPMHLYVLQSQFMRVMHGGKGSGQLIKGWKYKEGTSGGTIYDFDEIIHIKAPSPKEDALLWGMGVIEKLWDAHLLNKYSHQAQIGLYANNFIPDHIIINKSGNSISKKRFFNQMKELTRGAVNRGKSWFIDADVDIKSVAFKPKDLSDIKFNIQEIASVSGCPINKLLGNDQIKNNSLTQNTEWLRNTIHPLMKLIASGLSEQLLPKYNIADGEAFLLYDNPVPEDREFELKRNLEYVKNAIKTSNEIRISIGDEPLGPEADELFFNGNRLGDNKTSSPLPEKNITTETKQPINININNIEDIQPIDTIDEIKDTEIIEEISLVNKIADRIIKIK